MYKNIYPFSLLLFLSLSLSLFISVSYTEYCIVYLISISTISNFSSLLLLFILLLILIHMVEAVWLVLIMMQANHRHQLSWAVVLLDQVLLVLDLVVKISVLMIMP